MEYQQERSVGGKVAGGEWRLSEKQHGVVTQAQLVELGLHPQAIKRRIATGRLHRVRDGVYAVGRPQLTRHGQWMAAVLACGAQAVLSHGSAAALWEIGSERRGRIEVSVLTGTQRRREAVVAYRRTILARDEIAVRDGVPLTAPIRTLVDIACRLDKRRLERAIKEADARGLVDPETLSAALDEMRGQRGVGVLRATLDRRTFALTDSELERRFLPIARRAGLPPPRTQRS